MERCDLYFFPFFLLIVLYFLNIMAEPMETDLHKEEEEEETQTLRNKSSVSHSTNAKKRRR